MNRIIKRILINLVSLLILVLSNYASYTFLVNGDVGGFWRTLELPLIIDAVALIGMIVVSGLDVSTMKNAGLTEAYKIAAISGMIGVINVVLGYASVYKTENPIRWAILAFMFNATLTAVFFFSKRLFLHLRTQTIAKRAENRKKVIIVGAGQAGSELAHEMIFNEKGGMYPVCFVDDDPNKLSQRISGIRVEGKISDIEELCEKYSPDRIAVAIPSADSKRMKEILALCQNTKVRVVKLPGLLDLVDYDGVNMQSLREVDVQDLLGREPITVDTRELGENIKGKVVLVTGGGGSIGSELCRQIASYSPARLIIFDIYENNAYEIEQELKRKYPDLDLLTLIGSVRDKTKVFRMFEKYEPQIVFNAAAHKHVPLMETSPNEAVKNNVFGTLNVALAAEKYQVEKFVQISTDKAVNPTNIMGATKRIGEMIIQTIGRRCKTTKFVAVRFGNVLGSNGSVIPLFKKQIAKGGPVTVTHKDIIRYFMTIPEAVSLVLQACCYANAGEIFVFDMGEPVRIYDLAENLIRMSGLVPDKDIKIVCTGLRPGEKLYEERLMSEEGMKKTANDKISIGKPLDIDEDLLFGHLEKLKEAVESEGTKTKALVKELVPTYKIDER